MLAAAAAMEKTWTFEELCAIEPGLLALEEEVRSCEDDGTGSFFCSNYAWLPLNAKLKALIGVARPGVSRAAPDDVRYSSHAYEAAYLHLSRFLPPCRDCGCCLYAPIFQEQLTRCLAGEYEVFEPGPEAGATGEPVAPEAPGEAEALEHADA